jgi:GTPase SAR1 family protein
MIIVVEGAPGSGKTTLAKRLIKNATQTGYVVYYRYERPRDRYDLSGAIKAIESITHNAKPNDLIVFDRHPLISQPIFAPYTFDARCEGALIADLIYYCDPGIAEQKANRSTSPFFEHLETIREVYSETMLRVMKETGIEVKLYDYTKESI